MKSEPAKDLAIYNDVRISKWPEDFWSMQKQAL